MRSGLLRCVSSEWLYRFWHHSGSFSLFHKCVKSSLERHYPIISLTSQSFHSCSQSGIRAFLFHLITSDQPILSRTNKRTTHSKHITLSPMHVFFRLAILHHPNSLPHLLAQLVVQRRLARDAFFPHANGRPIGLSIPDDSPPHSLRHLPQPHVAGSLLDLLQKRRRLLGHRRRLLRSRLRR